MDWNLPGFSVHGVSQARILEWVAISFSGGEGVFLTRGLNPHLLLCKWILCHWATRETHGRRTEQWLPGAERNGGMLFNEHSVSYACRVRSRDPWKETASVNKPVLWDCATCRHVGGHAPLRYSRSYHNIAKQLSSEKHFVKRILSQDTFLFQKEEKRKGIFSSCPSLQAVWSHLSWFWLRVCASPGPGPSLRGRRMVRLGLDLRGYGGTSKSRLSEPQPPHHSHGGNCYFTGQLRIQFHNAYAIVLQNQRPK